MFQAASYAGYKLCWPNDLVINSLWAWMTGLGFSKYHGIISTAYSVFRIWNQGKFDSDYGNYLLRSKTYNWEFRVRSKGIWRSRYQLADDSFLSMPLLIPPLNEQQQISRYLDWQTSKINKFIKAKKKLIDLFIERRNTLTNSAIANHAAKHLRIQTISEQVSRPILRENAREYTPVGLFNRGRGIFLKPTTLGAELGDSTFYWIKEGDLVISGQFAWEGAVAVATQKEEGCIASHRYPILEAKHEIVLTSFLWAFFQTKLGNLLLNYHSRGAAGRNRPLNIRTLIKEKIPVPPLNLQEEIDELIKQELQLKAKIKKQEELLKEYRSRLVSDVVTGKVDVSSVEIPDFEPVEVDLEAQDIEESEDELLTEGEE